MAAAGCLGVAVCAQGRHKGLPLWTCSLTVPAKRATVKWPAACRATNLLAAGDRGDTPGGAASPALSSGILQLQGLTLGYTESGYGYLVLIVCEPGAGLATVELKLAELLNCIDVLAGPQLHNLISSCDGPDALQEQISQDPDILTTLTSKLAERAASLPPVAPGSITSLLRRRSQLSPSPGAPAPVSAAFSTLSRLLPVATSMEPANPLMFRISSHHVVLRDLRSTPHSTTPVVHATATATRGGAVLPGPQPEVLFSDLLDVRVARARGVSEDDLAAVEDVVESVVDMVQSDSSQLWALIAQELQVVAAEQSAEAGRATAPPEYGAQQRTGSSAAPLAHRYCTLDLSCIQPGLMVSAVTMQLGAPRAASARPGMTSGPSRRSSITGVAPPPPRQRRHCNPHLVVIYINHDDEQTAQVFQGAASFGAGGGSGQGQGSAPARNAPVRTSTFKGLSYQVASGPVAAPLSVLRLLQEAAGHYMAAFPASLEQLLQGEGRSLEEAGGLVGGAEHLQRLSPVSAGWATGPLDTGSVVSGTAAAGGAGDQADTVSAWEAEVSAVNVAPAGRASAAAERVTGDGHYTRADSGTPVRVDHGAVVADPSLVAPVLGAAGRQRRAAPIPSRGSLLPGGAGAPGPVPAAAAATATGSAPEQDGNRGSTGWSFGTRAQPPAWMLDSGLASPRASGDNGSRGCAGGGSTGSGAAARTGTSKSDAGTAAAVAARSGPGGLIDSGYGNDRDSSSGMKRGSSGLSTSSSGAGGGLDLPGLGAPAAASAPAPVPDQVLGAPARSHPASSGSSGRVPPASAGTRAKVPLLSLMQPLGAQPGAVQQLAAPLWPGVQAPLAAASKAEAPLATAEPPAAATGLWAPVEMAEPAALLDLERASPAGPMDVATVPPGAMVWPGDRTATGGAVSKDPRAPASGLHAGPSGGIKSSASSSSGSSSGSSVGGGSGHFGPGQPRLRRGYAVLCEEGTAHVAPDLATRHEGGLQTGLLSDSGSSKQILELATASRRGSSDGDEPLNASGPGEERPRGTDARGASLPATGEASTSRRASQQGSTSATQPAAAVASTGGVERPYLSTSSSLSDDAIREEPKTAAAAAGKDAAQPCEPLSRIDAGEGGRPSAAGRAPVAYGAGVEPVGPSESQNSGRSSRVTSGGGGAGSGFAADLPAASLGGASARHVIPRDVLTAAEARGAAAAQSTGALEAQPELAQSAAEPLAVALPWQPAATREACSDDGSPLMHPSVTALAGGSSAAMASDPPVPQPATEPTTERPSGHAVEAMACSVESRPAPALVSDALGRECTAGHPGALSSVPAEAAAGARQGSGAPGGNAPGPVTGTNVDMPVAPTQQQRARSFQRTAHFGNADAGAGAGHATTSVPAAAAAEEAMPVAVPTGAPAQQHHADSLRHTAHSGRVDAGAGAGPATAPAPTAAAAAAASVVPAAVATGSDTATVRLSAGERPTMGIQQQGATAAAAAVPALEGPAAAVPLATAALDTLRPPRLTHDIPHSTTSLPRTSSALPTSAHSKDGGSHVSFSSAATSVTTSPSSCTTQPSRHHAASPGGHRHHRHGRRSTHHHHYYYYDAPSGQCYPGDRHGPRAHTRRRHPADPHTAYSTSWDQLMMEASSPRSQGQPHPSMPPPSNPYPFQYGYPHQLYPVPYPYGFGPMPWGASSVPWAPSSQPPYVPYPLPVVAEPPPAARVVPPPAGHAAEATTPAMPSAGKATGAQLAAAPVVADRHPGPLLPRTVATQRPSSYAVPASSGPPPPASRAPHADTARAPQQDPQASPTVSDSNLAELQQRLARQRSESAERWRHVEDLRPAAPVSAYGLQLRSAVHVVADSVSRARGGPSAPVEQQHQARPPVVPRGPSGRHGGQRENERGGDSVVAPGNTSQRRGPQQQPATTPTQRFNTSSHRPVFGDRTNAQTMDVVGGVRKGIQAAGEEGAKIGAHTEEVAAGFPREKRYSGRPAAGVPAQRSGHRVHWSLGTPSDEQDAARSSVRDEDAAGVPGFPEGRSLPLSKLTAVAAAAAAAAAAATAAVMVPAQAAMQVRSDGLARQQLQQQEQQRDVCGLRAGDATMRGLAGAMGAGMVDVGVQASPPHGQVAAAVLQPQHPCGSGAWQAVTAPAAPNTSWRQQLSPAILQGQEQQVKQPQQQRARGLAAEPAEPRIRTPQMSSATDLGPAGRHDSLAAEQPLAIARVDIGQLQGGHGTRRAVVRQHAVSHGSQTPGKGRRPLPVVASPMQTRYPYGTVVPWVRVMSAVVQGARQNRSQALSGGQALQQLGPRDEADEPGALGTRVAPAAQPADGTVTGDGSRAVGSTHVSGVGGFCSSGGVSCSGGSGGEGSNPCRRDHASDRGDAGAGAQAADGMSVAASGGHREGSARCAGPQLRHESTRRTELVSSAEVLMRVAKRLEALAVG